MAPKRLTPDFQKQSSRGCLYSSSPLEVFLGKGVLKTCSKSTGKHPYRSLPCPFLNKKKSALILQKSTLILGKSARNAYRSEHIPRNLPCPEIFLVARLKRCSACNSIKKETSTQVFSFEFQEIFKKAFFKRTPLVAASRFYCANKLQNLLCVRFLHFLFSGYIFWFFFL